MKKHALSVKQCVLPVAAVCVIALIFISKATDDPASSDVRPTLAATNGQVTSARIADNGIRVWSRDYEKWKRNRTICENLKFDFSGQLKTSRGLIPMSIYNPENDIFISGKIFRKNEFDGKKRKLITDILKEDQNLNFIDFGCNIGVYTLTVANMGRRVLCVDALFLNVQHVCASVHSNRFHRNVDIVLNAVSSGHGEVEMAVDFKNMGGTFVDQDAAFVKAKKGKTVTGNHYSNVTTITIDDLLTLPVMKNFPTVFIKMDIEGFEARALEKADNFFNTIHVRGILMEWIFHRGTQSGLRIVNFMIRHRFKPFSMAGLQPLPPSPNGNWPGMDVLWFRQEDVM